MNSLLPRWGGSYEAMMQFAKESAPYAAKNPRIRALAGFADWDRGRLLEKRGKKDAAINAYTRALEFGDFWKFRYARGALYYHVRRNEDALEDLNRALTQTPEDPDALYFRSCANYALGFDAKGEARSAYFAHAYDDIELAVALDPTDTWYQKQLVWVQKNIPEYAPPPRL
jgi:tetratricopeptide (TPR) repeat protein